MADEASAGERDDQAPDLSARAGWTLVGIVVVSLLVIPAMIVLWPPTFLPYRDAYLALSLIPGLLLGGAAVWTVLRTRR